MCDANAVVQAFIGRAARILVSNAEGISLSFDWSSEAALEDPNSCSQWLMRCTQRSGISNHYLAYRRTQPSQAIDYLFDTLQEQGGKGTTRGESRTIT